MWTAVPVCTAVPLSTGPPCGRPGQKGSSSGSSPGGWWSTGSSRGSNRGRGDPPSDVAGLGGAGCAGAGAGLGVVAAWVSRPVSRPTSRSARRASIPRGLSVPTPRARRESTGRPSGHRGREQRPERAHPDFFVADRDAAVASSAALPVGSSVRVDREYGSTEGRPELGLRLLGRRQGSCSARRVPSRREVAGGVADRGEPAFVELPVLPGPECVGNAEDEFEHSIGTAAGRARPRQARTGWSPRSGRSRPATGRRTGASWRTRPPVGPGGPRPMRRGVRTRPSRRSGGPRREGRVGGVGVELEGRPAGRLLVSGVGFRGAVYSQRVPLFPPPGARSPGAGPWDGAGQGIIGGVTASVNPSPCRG
jgi:hypothetical protein